MTSADSTPTPLHRSARTGTPLRNQNRNQTVMAKRRCVPTPAKIPAARRILRVAPMMTDVSLTRSDAPAPEL